MTLDPFGKIAAAEVAFYVPVLCIAFAVTLKNGFGRRQGWVFLFIFSLVRIIGAAITIAYRSSSHPQIGLIIAATILSGIGLSPLMLATKAFIARVAEFGWQRGSARPLNLVRILLAAAPILAAVGGSKLSPGNSQDDINTGRTLTRVAVVLFMVAFVALVAINVRLWRERLIIPMQHLKLLSGITLAMPPLFIRLVYSLLGAFANSSSSQWSPIAGDWRIFLGMGLIMEYLVVGVYVIVGLLTPLKQEEEELDMKLMGASTDVHYSRVGREGTNA